MSTDVITNANAKSRTKVRMMVQIGMLAAISVVLMQFEVPFPLLRHSTRLTSARYRFW